jgi:RNA polymerase sigma factor for flagellar operon FliA
VLSLYYEHELNMEEIGEVIGLNKSTVCRSHGRALLMLRTALAERQPAARAMAQAARG